MERNFALIVSVGNQFYGIDSRYVNEVLIYQYISRQADIEPPYVGTVNIRGQKLPVIHAAAHLIGRTRKVSSTGTVVVLRNEVMGKISKIAVLVDSIEDLVEVTDYAERDVRSIHQKQMRYVQGTFSFLEEEVLDLNVEAFAFSKKQLPSSVKKEESISVA
jgi:purine-binding chemotaxis protein CheW